MDSLGDIPTTRAISQQLEEVAVGRGCGSVPSADQARRPRGTGETEDVAPSLCGALDSGQLRWEEDTVLTCRRRSRRSRLAGRLCFCTARPDPAVRTARPDPAV